MLTITYGDRARLVGVALVTSVAFIAAACGGETHQREAVAARDPVAVQVTSVTQAQRASTVEVGGLVHARTTAVVTSRLMAPVREVRVVPGDQVRAGQILVVLDDRDLGAQALGARSAALAAEQSVVAGGADRRAAEASLALATASHARIVTLHARKSATSQELDEATASLRAAEASLAAIDARVQQARASLASAQAGSTAAAVTASFAVITAPFAGVITESLVEAGNMAMPGTPLLRVEERGAFRLELRVDASRVADLSVGQALTVVFDAGEPLQLQGTVSEVARAMEADARAYLVKVALPAEPRLRSGMFGRAQFPGPSSSVLLVPPTAVGRHGQVATVFVVEAETARLRLVVLGRTLSEGVEVVSGVSDGERVITAPPAGLTDGVRVRTGAK